MAKYAAVCNRFPELQIGTEIKFAEGSFETDDPDLWAKLQANEWWNVLIHPRDVAPEAAATAEPTPEPSSEEPQGEEPEESRSTRVHRGSRGTR